jgi:hypothetical protein
MHIPKLATEIMPAIPELLIMYVSPRNHPYVIQTTLDISAWITNIGSTIVCSVIHCLISVGNNNDMDVMVAAAPTIVTISTILRPPGVCELFPQLLLFGIGYVMGGNIKYFWYIVLFLDSFVMPFIVRIIFLTCNFRTEQHIEYV